MTKAPFIGNYERGKVMLELVHIDVCGSFISTTRNNERYFITSTNDFNRYDCVNLIKHKSKTFNVFKTY